MINVHRQTNMDAINSLPQVAPRIVREDEIQEMRKQIKKRCDKRIELYNAGIKQWDTSVSLIMILRGKKYFFIFFVDILSFGDILIANEHKPMNKSSRNKVMFSESCRLV